MQAATCRVCSSGSSRGQSAQHLQQCVLSSRWRPCRRKTSCLWLVLALLACCSVAASACERHRGAHAHSAADTDTPASALTPAARSIAADAAVDEEPVSIHYEDISEAQLVEAVAAAAARRRQLLASDPSAAATAAAATDINDAYEESADADLYSDDAAATADTEQRPVRRCGARDVTPKERSEVSLHLEHHKARQSVRSRARLSSMAAAAALPVSRSSLNVPLYFHVITGKKKNSTVDAPQELLLKQLQAMNDAYGRYSIRFDLKGITRVQSEAWSIAEINSAEETLMKSKLRKGGLGDLNIYVIRPASGTLGWSTFPWEAVKLGESFDGVLVHVGTMPGGTMKPYNKGYTMVHEVGHWLGLLHVFENGCDTPGDSVDDTPPQASAAYGCPITRKSCPGSINTDPVTNMMGYTDDACMVGFTRGQADRVLAMWDIYRAPNAQQKVIAEKSLTQQGPAVKQPKQAQQPQQQQPGVALLEQGQQQLPDSIQFIPSAPPVDPAAGIAAKHAAAAAPPTSTSFSFTLDRKPASSKQQQQQHNTPAGPSKPRWPALLPGASLIGFNAPAAMLDASSQVKQAQEELQKHSKHKHKQHKGGWGSWLQVKPAPAAPDSSKSAGTVDVASLSAGYQEQLLPELGQYAAAPAAPPVLQPWGQPQPQQQQLLQQQQYQYAYVQQQQQQQQQQQPVYSQHQQGQILPAGYAGNLPLGPQYLVGGVDAGSDASQAALLTAMGGVQGYDPYESVYNGAGAGGFSVASAAAALTELSEKHGGRKSRKRKAKLATG